MNTPTVRPLHLATNLKKYREDAPAPTCSVCGKPIPPSRKGATPAMVAGATTEITGSAMCEACFVAWQDAQGGET